MDGLISVNSSNDLSESSSVASFDSQETDFTDQTDQTDLISNVSKKVDRSPSDVRSFPGHNDAIPHLDDPLPIVDEGRVLKEELMTEEDSVPLDSYAQYDEEENFTKEMNTTKIAFSAYRNTVLHLVHHQPSPSAKKSGEVNKEEKGDVGPSSPGRDSFEDNANQRMKALESVAKEIVETKAKACFEAVDVANEFVDRRLAREGARAGRSALFEELLQPKESSTTPQMSMSEEEHIIPENNDDAHVNKIDEVNENTAPKKEEPLKTSTNIDKPKVTKVVKLVNKKVKTGDNNNNNNSSNNNAQRLAYVKRRKSTKHPDCILETLPKFKFRPETEDDENVKNDDEENPAIYGTSSWIGNMVKWRMQRKTYKIYSYQKCGCPDCRKELEKVVST